MEISRDACCQNVQHVTSASASHMPTPASRYSAHAGADASGNLPFLLARATARLSLHLQHTSAVPVLQTGSDGRRRKDWQDATSPHELPTNCYACPASGFATLRDNPCGGQQRAHFAVRFKVKQLARTAAVPGHPTPRAPPAAHTPLAAASQFHAGGVGADPGCQSPSHT